MSEATPAATPATEIAVITPINACRRFARKYLLAIKSSNLIGGRFRFELKREHRDYIGRDESEAKLGFASEVWAARPVPCRGMRDIVARICARVPDPPSGS